MRCKLPAARTTNGLRAELPFYLQRHTGSGAAPAMQHPQWPSHWTALSELHFTAVRSSNPRSEGRYITRLRPYTHDEDGDLVVPRRGASPGGALKDEDPARESELEILIQHAGETLMADVGLQLWAGSLILAEYLFAHPEVVKSRVVLELGAGVALPSMFAARAGARKVFATDYAVEIYPTVLTRYD